MLENTFFDLQFRGEQFENMGGARLLRYAPIARFATLPPIIQGFIIGTPTWVDNDEQWVELKPTEDTASFDEPMERGPGGPLYESTFNCQVAGDHDSTRMLLDSMVRVPVIAEVTDNNGLVRRMGELADPAWMTIEFGTGTTAASRRAWSITVEWRSEIPCAVVDANFSPGLPPEDDDSDSGPGTGIDDSGTDV
jgi:hypothetical protein